MLISIKTGFKNSLGCIDIDPSVIQPLEPLVNLFNTKTSINKIIIRIYMSILYFSIFLNLILDIIKHIISDKLTQILCFIFKEVGKYIILIINNMIIGINIRYFLFIYLVCT